MVDGRRMCFLKKKMHPTHLAYSYVCVCAQRAGSPDLSRKHPALIPKSSNLSVSSTVVLLHAALYSRECVSYC